MSTRIPAGTLTFELGGANVSQGTLGATQKLIHEKFSSELPSTLFHSQQSVLKLLEASDAEFKGHLSTLVDAATWQACESAAKERETEALAALYDAAGSLRTLQAASKKAKAAAEGAQVRAHAIDQLHFVAQALSAECPQARKS
jgi:hypothetical protein